MNRPNLHPCISSGLLIVSLLLAGCSTTPAPVESPSDEQPVEAPLPQPVLEALRARLETGELQAVAIAVVDAQGTAFHNFGTLSAAQAVAPDHNTLFEIGSCTKPFTGLMLADAIQRNEVTLQTPIDKLLPDGHQQKAKEPITLKHLVTHTSGLPRLDPRHQPSDGDNPYVDYTRDMLWSLPSEWSSEPGTAHAYSNYGMGLLGELLAHRQKRTYEDLLKARVLEPLKLKDTTISLSPDQRERLAQPHGVGIPVPAWDFPTLPGAGALRSTTADLSRFLATQAGLQTSPLQEAITLSHTSQAPGPNDEWTLGLAWLIGTQTPPQIIFHNGATAGSKCFMGVDPINKRAVVVLANADGTIDDLGFHVLNNNAPIRPTEKHVPVPQAILDRYAGRYQIIPEFVLTITPIPGGLAVQATGQPRFRVYADSETEFHLTVVPAKITFHVSESGEVEALTLHQNGRDMRANKID